MRLDHRLILALDVTDPKRAVELTGFTRPHVDAVKVGWPLVLAGGLDVVRTLSESAYVLCDFKIADIPNTNRLIVEQAVDAGASGIICHGFVGEDAVRACVDAAGGKDVFVLVEMSHPGGMEYTAKHAEDLARLATRANAHGIIAPATRPERVEALRAIIGRKQILAPGVGAQGGKASEAIAAGADAVIVGRAIYEAANPAAAAKAIATEIRSVVSQ
jgi:orotidine-5'-phosphate decarboxylase